METVVLKGDDFKTVHNTLCDLRNLQRQLDGVISDSLAVHLQRIVKSFEQGLADAYQQDEAESDRKHEHYSLVAESHGFRSVWSCYEADNLAADHPFQNAQQVLYRDHWGGQPVVADIQGSTWVDLYRAADECIRNSGDGHHCFIEQFTHNPEDPSQLLLSTGS